LHSTNNDNFSLTAVISVLMWRNCNCAEMQMFLQTCWRTSTGRVVVRWT